MGDPARRDDVTDDDLLVAVASGDRAALAELYDRYAGLVANLARRFLGGGEAEDLVHDVFVEVWQRAGQYDPRRASVRAFVLMVARSRALDRTRSAGHTRRDPRPVDDVAESAAPARPESPDDTRVRAALADLPPPQRAVIWLGYFEGLSATEIAERVGVPAGTVKSRTAAALRSLRARFGREDVR